MTREAIDVLVFDLMDTVIVDPFYELVPRALGMTLEELFAVKDPTAWLEFEAGEIDEAGYFARCFTAEHADRLPSPRLVKDAAVQGSRLVAGMAPLLAELHGGPCALWALSNYSCWFEPIRARLGLDRFFDGYVISYQIGCRKPDPRAYRALCARASVQPARCLVIDDRETNVAGAQAVGMHALRFHDAPTLRADLATLGLL